MSVVFAVFLFWLLLRCLTLCPHGQKRNRKSQLFVSALHSLNVQSSVPGGSSVKHEQQSPISALKNIKQKLLCPPGGSLTLDALISRQPIKAPPGGGWRSSNCELSCDSKAFLFVFFLLPFSKSDRLEPSAGLIRDDSLHLINQSMALLEPQFFITKILFCIFLCVSCYRGECLYCHIFYVFSK